MKPNKDRDKVEKVPNYGRDNVWKNDKSAQKTQSEFEIETKAITHLKSKCDSMIYLWWRNNQQRDGRKTECK